MPLKLSQQTGVGTGSRGRPIHVHSGQARERRRPRAQRAVLPLQFTVDSANATRRLPARREVPERSDTRLGNPSGSTMAWLAGLTIVPQVPRVAQGLTMPHEALRHLLVGMAINEAAERCNSGLSSQPDRSARPRASDGAVRLAAVSVMLKHILEVVRWAQGDNAPGHSRPMSLATSESGCSWKTSSNTNHCTWIGPRGSRAAGRPMKRVHSEAAGSPPRDCKHIIHSSHVLNRRAGRHQFPESAAGSSASYQDGECVACHSEGGELTRYAIARNVAPRARRKFRDLQTQSTIISGGSRSPTLL